MVLALLHPALVEIEFRFTCFVEIEVVAIAEIRRVWSLGVYPSAWLLHPTKGNSVGGVSRLPQDCRAEMFGVEPVAASCRLGVIRKFLEVRSDVDVPLDSDVAQRIACQDCPDRRAQLFE